MFTNKWCVKVTPENHEILTKWKLKVSKGYYAEPSKHCSYVDYEGAGHLCSDSTKTPDYPIISWEEFEKYVLMIDRKIIGYKCPMDLFGGNVKKDWVLWKHENTNTYRPKGHGPSNALPAELVEQWEPVYDKSNEFTMTCDSGTYTLRVSTEGIEWVEGAKMLDVVAIKNFIADMMDYKVHDYIFQPTHFSAGCKHGSKISEWRQVINYYNNL
jgi:hypothetical protein